MSDQPLNKRKCVPCEDKSGRLDHDDIQPLKEELDRWNIIDDKKIEKTLRFKDFASAVAFVNKVAEIAESENHHPDISIFSWNKVKFTLSTHSVGGLTENDFILASKIDEVSR